MNTITVTKDQFVFKVQFAVEDTKEAFFEMLNDFKATIPSFARKWQPAEKVWEVTNTHEAVLKKWCMESKWWNVIVWNGQTFGQSDSGKSQDSKKKASADDFEDFADLDVDPKRKEKEKLYAVLYLTPDAPFEIVKLVWKKLITLYHPDKGGDVKKAAAINAAYQQIEDEVGGSNV
jgi:hypothetical protein